MSSQNNKIHFIQTGGTIDGLEYSTENSTPTQQPILPELLRRANVSVEYDMDRALFKDSKFITQADRDLIYEKCKASTSSKIIISHGTASMSETAKFLKGKALNKTIVLVGSMKLGTEPDSDALFNLGSAFVAAELLQPGVYITMNGKVFDADNAKKNPSKNVFEKEH